MAQGDTYTGSEIAIVGMACRFPGASTPEQFWRNLRDGVESLVELTDEELRAAGVPAEQIQDPAYVRRVSVVDDIEDFDASFFGYTPLEATIMDPQHRLFLECAWEVFERAGYHPEAYAHPVGVFTGAKTNTYLFNVVAQRGRFPSLDNFQIALGSDLAMMATRVSYKLDLRGPSYALHTACSTSLVAVHLACQSLLLDECRMAVAGGAAINVPQRRGYPYQKGGILSPDGSCRTFDEAAAGSNFGNGAGAVLLKRLDDALADGDPIQAVIRGSATNNDGARKASFTAPGVEGQTAVLLEAMAVAGVEADDVSYVEAHGTATDLGDSIEMLALTEAFRASTKRTGYCAIGSAKTNVGHLETAAGVAGLIKTASALEAKELPPSLHFERPNPKIDFASSPFVVNSELRPWPEPPAGKKRIAGLSSFGIGSTNAHMILEEPPAPSPSVPGRPWQQLLLSARSESALATMGENLGRHLAERGELELADVAYTLQVGRKAFEHRRAVVCRDLAAAVAALAPGDGEAGAERDRSAVVATTRRRTVFLFPGLGEQYVDMGLGLYQREPVFRAALDWAAEHLAPLLGTDLREVIYPRGTEAEEAGGGGIDLKAMLGRGGAVADAASRRLDRTVFAQPATFAVELALAELFRHRGVRPQATIGYSLGEYVCACLGGTLSFEDALTLVARRAQLIDALPGGAMLAVTQGEAELTPRLQSHGLSLAAVNGVTGCVAAGPEEAMAALEAALDEDGVVHRRLATTHAFHSAMLEPAAAELTELARSFTLSRPEIPWVSNVTGERITPEEAVDPSYWARHMCAPVRFADGVGTLLAEGGERVLLEVGPGQSLASFARLHPECGKTRPVVAAMRGRHDRSSAVAAFLGAVGETWLAGVEVDWAASWEGERRRRVTLPTYPFERRRHWIDPDEATLARTSGREVVKAPAAPRKVADLEEWLYQPRWASCPWPAAPAAKTDELCLVLADALGVADALVRELDVAQVAVAVPGDAFARSEDGRFKLRPGHAEDYEALLGELAGGPRLARVLHLWNVAPTPPVPGDEAAFRAAQELGFYSLIALVKALSRRPAAGALEIDVVTSGVQEVTGDEPLVPERSSVLGAAVVIPQEHPQILCRVIDIEVAPHTAGEDGVDAESLARRLAAELGSPEAEPVVAHRGAERLVRSFERLAMPPAEDRFHFRDDGVYLILGGLGGIGLALAGHLAREHRAKLVLTRRTPLPKREEWDAILAGGDADERTRHAVEQVRLLEEAGAEVLAAAADVADEAAMRAVVDKARERFGTLHGVVHAAGVLAQDSFKTVASTGREECERHFVPKVYGLYVLERVLEGIDLDFCTLYSSLSTILGGLGYVGYAAANLFMGFFAARHNREAATAWQSVDWDSWHYEEDEAARGGLGTTLSELAMAPSEGIETLRRLLALEEPRHLVISTGALEPRIEQWVTMQTLRDAASAAGTALRRTEDLLDIGALERRIAETWGRILGTEDVGHEENFFDLGGNSLLAMQLVGELSRELEVQIAPVALFEAPTVSAMAQHLSGEPSPGEGTAAVEAPAVKAARRGAGERRDLAVIGMSGRFPGAGSVSAFWENLCAGRETISFFTDEELLAAGADPEVLCDPSYVKARPILEDIELFDAELFGYSPREAEIMDPQHRLFLECAWEAFEDAGYDTQRYPGRVGVYAGASISSYMQGLYSDPELLKSVDTFQILVGNEKDSLTTRVSYKLNLRGPSVAVQTFCSTSLVAVHMACQGLWTGEADMALAGGISIIVPQVSGYRHQEGGINSRDGHVRAFDAKATGMVFGNGAGLVVLKPLEDALAEGDQVYAVIKGTAVNNDGSLKAGYSAASIEGQSMVVADALEVSGVDPRTVTYVEAHGSGTGLGDPVEMAALARAFPAGRPRSCAVGSVKTNVGHLDRAAGVTGLIKTVLALRHGKIPPSLHFEEPNPEIDFTSGPFYVNTELADFPAVGDSPRRAGVTSLGIGGTNAHAVLEQAPSPSPSEASGELQLLVLSGHTATALEAATDRLAHALAEQELNLDDVAFTLQVGRCELEHRRFLVAANAAEAARLLRAGGRRSGEPGRVRSAAHKEGRRQLVFLFPGQGSQHPGMGRELYESEPAFRRELDRCAEILSPHLATDLRELIHPAEVTEEASRRLAETRFTQPALFAVEYALARTWTAWGLKPQAMIGHSVGEYVAACLAGVFSLEDALALVAERGRLIQELPGGEMLAVPLAEEEVLARLEGRELWLAAVNAADRVVVSGARETVAELAAELAADGVDARRLHTSHAFHSARLEPAVEPFVRCLEGVERRPPRIPFISCLTGTWITAEQAVDPRYWGAQLRQAVRFSDGAGEILGNAAAVLLEVGPGKTLTTLAQRHLEPRHGRSLIASLPSPKEERSAYEAVLAALGELWLARLSPDWAAVHGDARRRRISLPTYPFERRRHWVEPGAGAAGRGGLTAGRRPEEWLFQPVWKTSRLPRGGGGASGYLVLDDGGPLAEALEHRLAGAGRVVRRAGPAEAEDAEKLLDSLPGLPEVILDLRRLDTDAEAAEDFEPLLRFARALDRRADAPLALWVLTDGLHEVLVQEMPRPGAAVLPAVCRSLTRGTAHVVCRHLDLYATSEAASLPRLSAQVAAEVDAAPQELTVAYRGGRRFLPAVEAAAGDPASGDPAGETDAGLPAGTWLLTGGLSEPGFSLAQALSYGDGAAGDGVRRLVLLESEALPPRQEWPVLLEEKPPSSEEMSAFLAQLAADAAGIDMSRAEISVRMERLAETVERQSVPEDFETLADALCAAWSYHFFAEHADARPGLCTTRGELMEKLSVVPRFERFFDYLLYVLCRAGIVALDDDGVTFRELPEELSDPKALGELAKELHPDFAPGVDCVGHCATRYPEAFRGEVDPVSILFPGGSSEMLRQVMETQDRYSVNRIFYPVMVEVIREAAAGLSHRPLRVLEFGAGDGNLTWELAEALRGANVEYHMTDIGRAFVVAGQREAAARGLDFLRFGVLDVTRDPAAQGYERYGFDVLLAFDVVHATPDVAETMRNLRRLLAPGGWTMILEPTRDQHWISLIWGLAEGWWLYADEIRTLHPLLEPARWEELLAGLGFSYHGVFPLDAEERATVDHSLLVVQQDVDLRAGEYLETVVERWHERRRELAERVRKVGRLEAAGAEVEVWKSTAEEIPAAVGRARERWGRLRGVLHAAGAWNGAGLEDELDAAAYASVLASASATLSALEEGLADEEPEMKLLVSPLAAAGDELSGPANATDLYFAARASRGEGAAWRSLAWGVPIDGGTAGGGLARRGTNGGLPPHLGASALAAVLRAPELRRVLLTHQPAAAMAAAWNRLPTRRRPLEEALAIGGDEYVAPESEQEKGVAAIWEQVLGIARIGLHDNFFEVGGDSLIATQIHSRIVERFDVEMPVDKLFILATVEEQAREVAQIQTVREKEDHEEIMAVLAELSDDEVEETLLDLHATGD